MRDAAMLVYMVLVELVEQGSKSVAFGSYADTRERNCLPRSRPRAFRCYYIRPDEPAASSIRILDPSANQHRFQSQLSVMRKNRRT